MIAVTLGLVGLAVIMWPARAGAFGAASVRFSPPTRPAAVDTPVEGDAGPRADTHGSARPRTAIAVLVFGLILMIKPTPLGAVLAVAAFAVMQRSASRRQRIDHRTRLRQLPMVLDVAGLLLRSGSPPAAAAASAAMVCGPSLSPDFVKVARLQSMGQDPDTAWRTYLEDPVIGPVAQSAIRSAESGATLAAAWVHAASAARAERRVSAEVSARKAGVHALAPLGLCFLPAFICLGVVPIVIGLASDVFG